MLLLHLLGCVSYYAIGGGELSLTLTGVQDPSVEASWTLPGLDDPSGLGLPYNDSVPQFCGGLEGAWMHQVDDEPERLRGCGEGLAFELEFGHDPVYGVERGGDDAQVTLQVESEALGRVFFAYHPFATLRMEDATTGWLSDPSAPRYLPEDEGEPTAHFVVEMDWALDAGSRVLLGREPEL